MRRSAAEGEVNEAPRKLWGWGGGETNLVGTTVEGTDDERKAWYTALYHLYFQPSNIADVGAKPLYSTLSCWDTFRAAGPLYTILSPGRASTFVEAMLDQGKVTGFLPIWTLWGRDNQCMIGTHSVPMIVDAYLKGVWKGDAEAAFQQIKESLTQKHANRRKEDWELYDRYGFYPFDPCGGEYVIGAPQIKKMTIRCTPTPDTSTFFTITAKNLSRENKYVKSVTLNGKPVTDWKIRHADILRGGVLEFEMQAKPEGK